MGNDKGRIKTDPAFANPIYPKLQSIVKYVYCFYAVLVDFLKVEKPRILYSGHELIKDVTAKIPATTSNPMLTKPVMVPDIYKPMMSAATINLITRSA